MNEHIASAARRHGFEKDDGKPALVAATVYSGCDSDLLELSLSSIHKARTRKLFYAMKQSQSIPCCCCRVSYDSTSLIIIFCLDSWSSFVFRINLSVLWVMLPEYNSSTLFILIFNTILSWFGDHARFFLMFTKMFDIFETSTATTLTLGQSIGNHTGCFQIWTHTWYFQQNSSFENILHLEHNSNLCYIWYFWMFNEIILSFRLSVLRTSLLDSKLRTLELDPSWFWPHIC